MLQIHIPATLYCLYGVLTYPKDCAQICPPTSHSKAHMTLRGSTATKQILMVLRAPSGHPQPMKLFPRIWSDTVSNVSLRQDAAQACFSVPQTSHFVHTEPSVILNTAWRTLSSTITSDFGCRCPRVGPLSVAFPSPRTSGTEPPGDRPPQDDAKDVVPWLKLGLTCLDRASKIDNRTATTRRPKDS